MTIRGVSAACLVVAGLSGAGAAAGAQPLDAEAQERELVSLAAVVAAALRGEIVPTEEPFGWSNDFLKSGVEGITSIPFTLSIDESMLDAPSVAVRMFVMPRGAGAALPAAAFEDGYHVPLGAPTEDGFHEIRRGFWVPAGEYDVYVALSESEVEAGADPATMMLRKALSVPDLWTGGFATSSVIVAESIEALTTPPPPEQWPANPYTLGTMRIVPKSTLAYGTEDELSMLFLVYNAGVTAAGMPDVTVEYAFSGRGAAGEEFFNRRTESQAFNERTLPPGFDVNAGHQLVPGQAVPLSEFPPGEYRLEITVTDNTSGESLTRGVDFSVAES